MVTVKPSSLKTLRAAKLKLGCVTSWETAGTIKGNGLSYGHGICVGERSTSQIVISLGGRGGVGRKQQKTLKIRPFAEVGKHQ